MKKIYFGGKFNKSENKELSLANRLKNDYRAKLLQDPNKLVNASKNIKLNSKYEYSGPFYCEQASNGIFTSTDCRVIVKEEFKAVKNCDIFVAIFDENHSPGTVVELSWAISENKKIYILYKNQSSKYSVKSEQWFAITNAMLHSDNLTVIAYTNKNELIKLINKKILES